MDIHFDPSVFEKKALNHYLIFEGAVPPKLREAIEEWLAQFNANQLTDTIWCYRVPAYGPTVTERRKSFNQVLEMTPRGVSQGAYRIIQLHPFGQGALTHGMPQLNMSGNAGIRFGVGHKDPDDDK